MPSLKDLKRRIGSVKNTQQTTKAMKMVSAAKLRRAQDAIVGHRPYAQELLELLGGIVRSGVEIHSEFFRDSNKAGEPRKVLLVLVTSDRGLCGAFNSSAIKYAQKWITNNQAQCDKIALSFIGKKGADFFKDKGVPRGPDFGEIGLKASVLRARKISDELVSLYRAREYNEIRFIYNEFKNAISQRATEALFLPLDRSRWLASGTETIRDFNPIYKPSAPEIFQTLISKSFPIQVYRIMLESLAGEHGARMTAMENATRNAGEMIKKLTLQYNKQRQAGITKELLEIIAGSESQNQT
jgi:F-type H+-transporting ATPase subunit gamma